MERVFIIIRRVNSVLLLLVLLAGGAFAAWYAWYLHHWYAIHGQYSEPDAAAEVEEPQHLRLRDADSVTGTSTQMLNLTADRGGRRNTAIRNILFLAPDDAGGRWLFPTHSNLILESDQIRPWSADDSQAPSTALYFEFVRGEPDDEIGPSPFEPRSVALSNPDGTGLVEVLHQVDEVLAYDQLDAGVLTILYSDPTGLHRARVALGGFALLSDQLVADIPDSL